MAQRFKRPLKRIIAIAAVVVVALGICGVLFAWSGLYSVAASRGHWTIMQAFLEFAMRESVETHTIAIDVPPLDDPAMISAGLRHYDTACTACHGAPGRIANPMFAALLPQPPFLPSKVLEWQPEEMFWIVKNGLKYTGMPGWIARDREDEVWSVIAALQRLPRMTADEYRRLVGSEAGGGPDDIATCTRCHGIDGAGGGAGAFPRLAGQNERYLLETLQDYADGTRQSGIMQPAAAALTNDQKQWIARYYAAADAPTPKVNGAAGGAALAREGAPDDGIAACAACHPVDAAAALPQYPKIAGQHAWYLRQQLRLWRDGKRRNSPLSEIMTAAVRGLDDAQIDAVAGYYAGLPP